jgi:hypothetical protein
MPVNYVGQFWNQRVAGCESLNNREKYYMSSNDWHAIASCQFQMFCCLFRSFAQIDLLQFLRFDFKSYLMNLKTFRTFKSPLL